MRTLSLLTLVACAQEPALVADEATSPALEAVDSAEPAWLLDLTAEEVLELAVRYEIDGAELSTLLAAPFDCRTYGDLCAIAGAEEAEGIVLGLIEDMIAGASVEELQAAAESRVSDARDAQQARQAESGIPFGGTPSVSSRQSYRSPGGSNCEVKLTSEIIAWVWGQTEHKAQLTNRCQTWAGVWVPGMVGSLRVCLNSRRTSLGSTSTINLCNTASNWDSVSRSNWFSGGGSHTGAATGTISGANVSGSITRSATATLW